MHIRRVFTLAVAVATLVGAPVVVAQQNNQQPNRRDQERRSQQEQRDIHREGERDIGRSVRASDEVIAFPSKADVGGRRLFACGNGIDQLDERLDVALLLLAAPLLIAAVRLLIILLRDEGRRTAKRSHGDGQRKNPTNMHHASPEDEAPDRSHPRI